MLNFDVAAECSSVGGGESMRAERSLTSLVRRRRTLSQVPGKASREGWDEMCHEGSKARLKKPQQLGHAARC
jgi:hypothetical protein